MSEPVILTIADLKVAGSAKLPKPVRDYYNEGASDLITLRENEEAYNRLKIRPRVLKDVSNIDTSTTILGEKVPLPFGFSPAAKHGMAHPDGELATSRAAAWRGIPMALSLTSSTAMEDVIEARGSAQNPYAFQLYVMKNREETTLKWIRRAEASGYKALFVTVDNPVLGMRLNQVRNAFRSADYAPAPHYADGHPEKDLTNTWETIVPWLKANTKLEIWLKGIYTPEDVLLAIQYGADGVVISNHGGRQLDGVPATIQALPECAEAAQGRIKIAIDGGIRRGSDIFKALALGANFCFMGRVPLWGLAYDGQQGVQLAIQILENELRNVMALAGCASLKDITPKHLSIVDATGRLVRLG